MSSANLLALRQALHACIPHFQDISTLYPVLRLVWEHPDPSGLNIEGINRLAGGLRRGPVFHVEKSGDIDVLWVNHPAQGSPAIFQVRNPDRKPVSCGDYAIQEAHSNLAAWIGLTVTKRPGVKGKVGVAKRGVRRGTKNKPPTAQPVELRGRGEPPVVRGRQKQGPLTKAQYDVVAALLAAGERGLTKDALVANSNHADARGILSRLAKSDADWRAVIKFPGKSWVRYRIG